MTPSYRCGLNSAICFTFKPWHRKQEVTTETQSGCHLFILPGILGCCPCHYLVALYVHLLWQDFEFGTNGFGPWRGWARQRADSVQAVTMFSRFLFYRCRYYHINSCKHYPWVFALITALVIQCPRSITVAESYYSASPPTFLLGAQWR